MERYARKEKLHNLKSLITEKERLVASLTTNIRELQSEYAEEEKDLLPILLMVKSENYEHLEGIKECTAIYYFPELDTLEYKDYIKTKTITEEEVLPNTLDLQSYFNPLTIKCKNFSDYMHLAGEIKNYLSSIIDDIIIKNNPSNWEEIIKILVEKLNNSESLKRTLRKD